VLAKRKAAGTHELLIKAVDDDDESVRQLAVDALLVGEGDEALTAAMSSKHPDVVVRAATARAVHGDSAARAPLQAMIAEPEPEVAVAARQVARPRRACARRPRRARRPHRGLGRAPAAAAQGGEDPPGRRERARVDGPPRQRQRDLRPQGRAAAQRPRGPGRGRPRPRLHRRAVRLVDLFTAGKNAPAPELGLLAALALGLDDAFIAYLDHAKDRSATRPCCSSSCARWSRATACPTAASPPSRRPTRASACRRAGARALRRRRSLRQVRHRPDQRPRRGQAQVGRSPRPPCAASPSC
jgi:hypothetical protein